ncbi:MAG: hypothetical protein ACE5MB_03460 [Anaerolineae bacterium]
MPTTISIVVDAKDYEQIEYFVQAGYFKDAQELIQAAIREFLYELSLEESRRQPPPVELEKDEIVEELGEIRRLEREPLKPEEVGSEKSE